MNWQKIETAPKDGTWVLLFERKQMGCGFYRHGLWWTITADDGMGELFDNPTHWMPLPPPPEPDIE